MVLNFICFKIRLAVMMMSDVNFLHSLGQQYSSILWIFFLIKWKTFVNLPNIYSVCEIFIRMYAKVPQ